MRAEGSNGSVEVAGESVVIRRKGLANMLTQGIQGDKTIPISNITAVQFKEAGRWMAGMIQFTLVGGREVPGGLLEATKDENAVLFERKQQPAFEGIRDHARVQIGRLGSVPKSDGIAEELAKLADLVDRGFLSRDEFETRKARLLG